MEEEGNLKRINLSVEKETYLKAEKYLKSKGYKSFSEYIREQIRKINEEMNKKN